MTERAAAYRDRMRRSGWREVRIWVPDTRTPERRAALAAQGRAIAANTADEADVMRLIESWESETARHEAR
ncbi:MAG: antitoxin MazE family protein [Bifidobacteriaceae bacterium]|nr:antitoxin MazE family protein [Bifidobacteriaceae bacterium]